MTRREALLLVAVAIVVFILLKGKQKSAAPAPSVTVPVPNTIVNPASPAPLVLSPLTPPTPVAPAPGPGNALNINSDTGSEIPAIAYQLSDDYVLENGETVAINSYDDALNGGYLDAGVLDDDPTDSGNSTDEGS
jgi:hypothetical protein